MSGGNAFGDASGKTGDIDERFLAMWIRWRISQCCRTRARDQRLEYAYRVVVAGRNVNVRVDRPVFDVLDGFAGAEMHERS